jgi:thiol-disulfide isomerase/thioredoxin
MGDQQKSAQEQCPFGGDDGPQASKEEYNKYMKELHDIGSMSSTERAAWAAKTAAKAKQKSNDDIVAAELRAQEAARREREMMEAKKRQQTSIHPGIEAVDDAALSRLRNMREYDLLVTFYAPWCPHCKAFVTDANAPIAALSESLKAKGGPKVVTFDVTASQVSF